MKNVFFLTLLLAAFFACQNPGNPKSGAADPPIAEMARLELHVTGMTCAGCENSIESALSKEEGIDEVEASFQDEIVTLMYDASIISPGAIKEVIRQTGYTVVEDAP